MSNKTTPAKKSAKATLKKTTSPQRALKAAAKPKEKKRSYTPNLRGVFTLSLNELNEIFKDDPDHKIGVTKKSVVEYKTRKDREKAIEAMERDYGDDDYE